MEIGVDAGQVEETSAAGLLCSATRINDGPGRDSRLPEMAQCRCRVERQAAERIVMTRFQGNRFRLRRL